MSNDKKTVSDTRPDPMQPIPVELIKFVASTDLTKKSGASGLQTELFVNKASRRITYLPWMRHFKIEYFEIVGRDDQAVDYVHESRVNNWRAADRATAEAAYQEWLAAREKMASEAA